MFCNRLLFLLFFLALWRPASAQPVPEHVHPTRGNAPVSIQFSYEKKYPIGVPVIPPLSRDTPYFDGGLMGRLPDSNDYQPTGSGGFIKKNGRSEQKYVITNGAWRLLAGDRPVIGLALRDTSGAYAKPAILPHLGLRGKIRLELVKGKAVKFLEDFSDITTTLIAGEPTWTGIDSELDLKVTLTAYPFPDNFGLALVAWIETADAGTVTLRWHYEDALLMKDSSLFSEFSYDRYTRIFTGSASSRARYNNGIVQTLLSTNPKEPVADTLICSWGYSDYDHSAVADALQRLRFRPFPSAAWADTMKREWFHHWIGRGLEPEKKFISLRQQAAKTIARSRQYWASMRNQVRIKTGDARFDNAVESLGGRLISNFEYPGYMHGANYMKYGKINCGLYGHEAAGFHDEVASTLRFIAGTQDVKGRQRYFEPVFTISAWAEEIDPYFVDQVWYHYRWTGDKNFLAEMWPSVRRALEHFISVSDPLHNGSFTGYYENWNGDGKSRGGSGALWTAMGIQALRAGHEMASLLGDRDWDRETFQVSDNPSIDGDFSRRYQRLLQKAEAVYETRYNRKIGAYSSGDWQAELRNMPGNEESNYAIWRGIGDPLRNYCSMRFIRDHYHQPTTNGVIEYCNKDWPVCWSNHYDSYAEAMSSIASAAMANDIDHYWPLLKTAAEKIYTVPECTAIAGGRSLLSLESDQMLMMAVLDNIFGIKPDFGNNLIVIRPSFPSCWKNPEITLPDISYQYAAGDNEIRLSVTTPVDRLIRLEIPVRQAVAAVEINGQNKDFELRQEVNGCRVIVRSEAAGNHEIRILLKPGQVSVAGNVNAIVGQADTFRVSGASVVSIRNTQEDFGVVAVSGQTIRILPGKTGRYTLFAELKTGNISWFEPLELTVREPWTIKEAYRAWEENKPGKPLAAAALSPAIDEGNKLLLFELKNNLAEKQSGEMRVTVNGSVFVRQAILLPGQATAFTVPLGQDWTSLSPGTLAFTVALNGQIRKSQAIDWTIGKRTTGENWIPLDLRKSNNISLADLYGPGAFKWRIDYTGAAVGVDWRDTLFMDSLGYRLFSPPTSVVSYGVLPEQMSPSWWSVPHIPDSLKYPVPFPFIEHGPNRKNLIALVNAENNRQLPAGMVITLAQPVNAKKIYLLTASLTKPCKTYYPAAEIEIVYETGKNQLIQLIPPYNMPSFIQTFCPVAYAIPLGSIENKEIMDFTDPGLSVMDLVTDPGRKIRQILFRCVASETALGIIGVSLLGS
jgi:hypothetical protein